MSVTSLALLLVAAVLHAVSNALMKRARDKLAFAWWMLGVSSVLGLPIWLSVRNAEPTGWLLVVVSGLLEAIYFFALTRAYSHGDLSQVYPLARGSAPLFVLVWAAFFLGERPSAAGLAGILLVVAGLYLVNLPSLADWRRPLLGFNRPAPRWALFTGLMISSYSTVDKVGVRYFDPLTYLYLLLCVTWLAFTPQWWMSARRAALIREVWTSGDARDRRPDARSLLRIAGAAFGGLAAYVLVLTAMRLSPVSYVSPTRELSVVIGAWIGVRFMGEQGGGLRVAASALVAAGIILIAIAG